MCSDQRVLSSQIILSVFLLFVLVGKRFIWSINTLYFHVIIKVRKTYLKILMCLNGGAIVAHSCVVLCCLVKKYVEPTHSFFIFFYLLCRVFVLVLCTSSLSNQKKKKRNEGLSYCKWQTQKFYKVTFDLLRNY